MGVEGGVMGERACDEGGGGSSAAGQAERCSGKSPRYCPVIDISCSMHWPHTRHPNRKRKEHPRVWTKNRICRLVVHMYVCS